MTHLLNEAKRKFYTTLLRIIVVTREGYFVPLGRCLERMISHCRFLIMMISLYL